MGNQSQRKREAACAAERRAKKEAAKSAETISAQVDSAVPADNAVPATKQTKSALQKQVPSEALASTQRSTHSKRSASTSVPAASASTGSTSSQNTVTHLSNQSNTTSRPCRMNAASARAQLLQAALEDESEPEGDSNDDLDELSNDDLGHIVAKQHAEDPTSDIDIDDSIQLSSVGQLSLVVPKPAGSHGAPKKHTKVQVMEKPSHESDDSETGEFAFICLSFFTLLIIQTEAVEMKYECHDKANGTRHDLSLWSSSTWKELVDGAAEKFNVFPTSLRLQYIFSNERPTSLPFELNSEQAYQELLTKYKRLIDPGLTNSGKPRKSKPKTITIKLFNKNAESGEGGPKGKGKVGA